MAPGHEALALGPHSRRSVQDDIASLPEVLKSWDSCMAKSWCKYPIIAACVVGGLVLICTAWCCYRCCCRRRRKAKRSKSTFFNDPVPAYMTSGTTFAPDSNSAPNNLSGGAGGYSSSNIVGPSKIGGGAPAAPQYAYFETGTTGAKDNDELPVMPSWNGAKNEKVEDTTKVEAIELNEVDNNGRQPSAPSNPVGGHVQVSPPPPPQTNHMPLGADPFQYHPQAPHHPPPHHHQNFSPNPPVGAVGVNPFGPQRMNSPFAPNNAVAPPNRIQSPYPEGDSMPGFAAAHPVTTAHDLDFDFNPHINARNQGPYANADIYPPEPAYQPAVHQPQQPSPPQFTGTTNSTPTPAPITPAVAPPQPQQFTGTTTATPTPIPTPVGYVEAYSSPPRHLQSTGVPLPGGGFMAQMDDDYGHSPVHLTHPGGVANGFNPNDFDHGGYGSGYNNNNNNGNAPLQQQPSGAPGGYQPGQMGTMPSSGGNGGYHDGRHQPQPQAWPAF
ncbi:hypothetical protein DRE_03944 [Drechslerella stenobrocha 248]|uniref:Uncharacterized protein n=1 Tax=Drechslerella stenobrocha 248 TaxID=1043628 RepID=W7HTI7_9PEZI|nr:hypothetical protein DRE_03944 [Drechslerella stenobrocha 248]